MKKLESDKIAEKVAKKLLVEIGRAALRKDTECKVAKRLIELVVVRQKNGGLNNG